MKDDMDSDYCDRLPGQHTGRLSLELQASEAAEWQRRIAEREGSLRVARDTICELLEALSPAAGESPGIIPEPAQAHGRTPPATPSAAVGADGPGAGDQLPNPDTDWWEWKIRILECKLEGKDRVLKEQRDEIRRLTKLNHHLREVAVMAIVERVPNDSKPTNCINQESEDTPPRVNDVPATDKPFRLQYGKRYVRDDGQVSGPLERTASESQQGVTHPFRCPKYDITYDEDGSHVAGEQCPCNLVAEYIESSLSPPTESPDVSGEIRGLKYALEWIAAKRAGNPKLKSAAWEMLNDMQTAYEAAVARLQDGESINSTSQTDVPAESPDDWVTQDRVPARPRIDERRWVDKYGTPTCVWKPCRGNEIGLYHGDNSGTDYTLQLRCRRKDLPPVPVAQKTRTVTLREYSLFQDTSSAAWGWTEIIPGLPWRDTGRRCVVEVPE